jgi:hypothetical protein
MLIDEDNIIEEDIDQMMLESYGIKDSSFIVNGTLNESLDKKPRLYGVDGFLVYNMEDTLEHILKDDIFDAVLEELHDRADAEDAYVIVEQWSADFINNYVKDFLKGLTKGEELRYDELFRELAEKSDNDDLVRSIRSDDKRFEKMPKIVRIR